MSNALYIVSFLKSGISSLPHERFQFPPHLMPDYTGEEEDFDWEEEDTIREDIVLYILKDSIVTIVHNPGNYREYEVWVTHLIASDVENLACTLKLYDSEGQSIAEWEDCERTKAVMIRLSELTSPNSIFCTLVKDAIKLDAQEAAQSVGLEADSGATLEELKLWFETKPHEKFELFEAEDQDFDPEATDTEDKTTVYITDDLIALFVEFGPDRAFNGSLKTFNKTEYDIEQLVSFLNLMRNDGTYSWTEDKFAVSLIAALSSITPNLDFAQDYRDFVFRNNKPKGFSEGLQAVQRGLEAVGTQKFELENDDQSGERTLVYMSEPNIVVFHLPGSGEQEQMFVYHTNGTSLYELVNKFDLIVDNSDDDEIPEWEIRPNAGPLIERLVELAPDTKFAAAYREMMGLRNMKKKKPKRKQPVKKLPTKK